MMSVQLSSLVLLERLSEQPEAPGQGDKGENGFMLLNVVLEIRQATSTLTLHMFGCT